MPDAAPLAVPPDPMPYPDQDPDDLMRQSVKETFARIYRAGVRWNESGLERGIATMRDDKRRLEAAREADRTMGDAFLRVCQQAERSLLDELREAGVEGVRDR